MVSQTLGPIISESIIVSGLLIDWLHEPINSSFALSNFWLQVKETQYVIADVNILFQKP